MARTVQQERAYDARTDLLIFTHIPKTAGMTFKRILARQFPADQMPRIGPDYQRSVDQIRSLSETDQAIVQCLSGHIPFGISKYFPKKMPHYVSFVRDPVDRFTSEYFFLQRQPQLMPLIGLDVGTILSPQAFLEHQTSMGMMNFQTRVLSGYDDMVESVLPPYSAMSVENPEDLIEEVLNSYALIGTVEQFDESLLLMKKKFGWRSICYIRRNVARKNSERQHVKQTLGDEIRNRNPLDCTLHARAKKRVDAIIAQQGECFAQAFRRYKFHNRLYAQAWTLYRATGLRRVRKILGKVKASPKRSV